jgi:hypothetical protein
VSNAKFRQGAGLSLVGVTGSATANVADIVGTANQIPIVNSGATGFAFTTLSGDLTNSTGVFTIGTNVVTNAKAAQMAPNTIKGNNTGSTANAADLTVAQVTTMLGLSGGAMVLLNTLTASNSATLSDTTSFTSTYSSYQIVFENLVPVNNNDTFKVQVHSGGSFQATNYLSSNTTYYDIAGGTGVDNTAGKGLSGSMLISNPSSTTTMKIITSLVGFINSATMNSKANAGAWNGGLGAIDGFQVFYSSGNISTGTTKIYGITPCPSSGTTPDPLHVRQRSSSSVP